MSCARASWHFSCALVLAGCVVAAAGCSPSKTTTASSNCTPLGLATHTKGTFTIATDEPAYPPWFVDDRPANGKGFESAVAFAVAKQLGYPAGKVKWVVARFDSVVTPGPKKFDVDINEVSITAARKKAVDFTSGYYTVTQALIALKSSPLASATTIAALKNAKLGAQIGTTSYDTITDVIRPSKSPSVFQTNDVAKLALKNGQIQGLLTDLPTAFEITGAEITDAKIVGQFARSGSGGEQFGMVLQKGSPITSCVSKAVTALQKDGTLGKLRQQWLSTDAGAPILK